MLHRATVGVYNALRQRASPVARSSRRVRRKVLTDDTWAGPVTATGRPANGQVMTRVPAVRPPVASRIYPHEVSLGLLGFLLPLGEATQPAWLASGAVKVAAVALAAFLLASTAVMTASTLRLPEPARRVRVPLLVYLVVVVAATVSRDLPPARVQLMVGLLVVGAGFLVCEATRPGSFARIAYRVGAAHVLLVAATGETGTSTNGLERLEGAVHPVTLSFEATIAFAVAWLRFRGREGRFPLLSLAMAAVSVYVVFAAFSRASLITLCAGAVLLVVFRARKHRFLKGLSAGVVAALAYWTSADAVVESLGARSVASASGRYAIWDRLLGADVDWIRGYGYGALRDAYGPDVHLFRLNQGLPAENAFLQAALMAGVVGFALLAWMAWRSVRELWTIRDWGGGASLVIGLALAVNAMFSVGLATGSLAFWWLLGAFSLTVHARASTGSPASGVGASTARSRSAGPRPW